MEALLVSTAAVAIAEIGDKTQLLALVLAARYRRFWPVAAGILVATLLNHAAAAWAGAWLSSLLSPTAQRWVVALSFLAVAAWALVPDKLAEDEVPRPSSTSAFLATTLAFFLAEIGDKTQLATVVLAATYDVLPAVVAGTTLGMLAANLPVVALGGRYSGRLPLHWFRYGAAVLFAALAVATLLM